LLIFDFNDVLYFQAIYAVIDEVPKQLNEKQWRVLMVHTYNIGDRQEYLRQLYVHERNSEKVQKENEKRQLVSLIN
jgi:hypothetical protein